MPTEARLIAYLEGALAAETEAPLNVMAQLPAAPNVMKIWNPRARGDTRWFYEGTLRATAYGFIAHWLREQTRAHPGEERWILLAEQRYPVRATRNRADISLVNEAGGWVFVEIKADFTDTGVDRDLGKLVEARSELRERYRFGLLLFTVWNDQVVEEEWRNRFDAQMGRLSLGCARALVRR